MNPLNNSYFGQAQHREYEARYSQHGAERESFQSRPSFVSRHKVAVALSGASAVLAAIVALGF